MSTWKGKRIYTVGHSTRSLEELVQLLRAHEVDVLVDIRTVPRSRTNPQFNRDVLPESLRSGRVLYEHLPELGGLRRPREDSPNGAWRNTSFRGYADHMLTEEFEQGLAKLRTLAAKGRVAIMCAEAVPWRCHRSLVADALTVRGAHVVHITSATRANPHRVTPFAKVQTKRVTYPNSQEAGGPPSRAAAPHARTGGSARAASSRAAGLGIVEPDKAGASRPNSFFRVVRRIPAGRVTTYGAVAFLAGAPRAARQVGFALARQVRGDSSVPWHRVMGQRSTRFGAITIPDAEHAALQRRLLEKEGVRFDRIGRVPLAEFGWKPRQPKVEKPRHSKKKPR